MFQLEANYLSFVTHVNLPGNFYLADYDGLTYYKLPSAHCPPPVSVMPCRVLYPAVFVLLLLLERRTASQDPWSWRCDEAVCVKEEGRPGQARTSLNSCLLYCSPASLLWPRPRNSSLGKFSPPFLPHSLKFTDQEAVSCPSTWT